MTGITDMHLLVTDGSGSENSSTHLLRIELIRLLIMSCGMLSHYSSMAVRHCWVVGSSASLSSGFHPQSNGQSEHANQDLEMTLWCLISANPTTWSQQLVWVEYTRKTLPCSATGISPFECFLGYQPPLFPEQEEEVSHPCSATGLSPIECLLGY